ncbi:MAG TPA: 3-dehydroquinate synthase, partial [Ruminococcaceae bacterium]|nr:3-dehydroquinate synthase [Oscillospiraceae bacterium]
EKAGLTKAGTSDEIAQVLSKYGLPTSDSTDIDKIVGTAMLDKKARGSAINLVMLKQIGESFLYPADRNKLAELTEALK